MHALTAGLDTGALREGGGVESAMACAAGFHQITSGRQSSLRYENTANYACCGLAVR
jgi:hypothetical protein